MTETICPFCGKTNPSDAEFCWSCQAHLLPSGVSGLPNDASAEDIAKWLSETGGVGSKSQDNQPPQEDEPEWLARIHERMRWEKEQAQKADDLIPSEFEPPANEIPEWLKENSPSSQETSDVQSANDEANSNSALPDEPVQSQFSSENGKSDVPEAISHDTLPPINLSDLFHDEADHHLENIEGPETEAIKPPRITGELSGYVKPFHTGEIKELLGDDETPSQESSESVEQTVPKGEEKTPESSPAFASSDSEVPLDNNESESIEPDLPDWIKELGAEVPSEPEKDISVKPEDQTPTFSFTDLAAEKSIPESESEITPKQDEGIPAWLANLVKPDQIPIGESSPVFKSGDEELLTSETSEETPAKVQEQNEVIKPVDNSQLEPATLPPWMHAMRPIESALPENIQSLIEGKSTAESLGGMEDVLPTPVTPTEYSKPPVYEDQLNVTDRQRIHAELLQSLLTSEKTPQTATFKTPKDRSRIVKILINFIFIIIILSVLIFKLNVAPQASNFPSGSVSMVTGVSNLPDNAIVLIVADFESAYLGEMTSSASPVLKHLISKNSRLVLLSTNPTTPILIEKMVRDAAQDQISYPLEQNMENLGYIPAGATGLQNFATSAKLTVPYNWDQNLVTDSQIIDDSFALEDFHAVIVITGNYETGKLWLEQITPRMGDIPTWMVSSQQSTQLLSPYLESGQLKGLVSGMEGGLLYAQQVGIPQLDSSIWSAYQVGNSLALIIILLGGIIQIIVARPKRQRAKPEEVKNAVE